LAAVPNEDGSRKRIGGEHGHENNW
jgi:hypothetical protein